MARTMFKCSKCDRAFSSSVNLSRHTTIVHSSRLGRTRSAARAKAGRALVGRPRGVRGRRGPGRPRKSGPTGIQPFGDVSTRLVSDMRTYHSDLLVQRSSLEARIDALTRAMDALGTAAPVTSGRRTAGKKKRGRPPGSGIRAGSLKDHVVRVLRQTTKPMSPREISHKVVRAGFKSQAKDVTKAVSNKLAELQNVKKVGFGLYRLAS